MTTSSPGPEVEVSIHDGVHARIGAGKQEEPLLDPLVHGPCGRFVDPIPATDGCRYTLAHKLTKGENQAPAAKRLVLDPVKDRSICNGP
jgi:hypothetical protein